MFFYQLKLVVAENKLDEFVDSLRFLSSGIREEEGCLDFSLTRDLEIKDTYRVFGEWKAHQAMEGHFKREKFSLLIGAARVLGEDFEMSIGETLEKGSYQFAQEKISLHSGKGKIQKNQIPLNREIAGFGKDPAKQTIKKGVFQ